MLTLRRYAHLISAIGGGVIVAAVLTRSAGLPADPWPVVLLAAGVLAGELLPLRVPRGDGDERITFSTTFSFALLLVAGLLPALAAQAAASVLEDAKMRRPPWRMAFNVGQYTLSLGAAHGILVGLGLAAPAVPGHFGVAGLAGMALAGGAFFLVNFGLVAGALALHHGTRVLPLLRRDMSFTAISGGALLLLSPLLVAVTEYSWPLFVLFVVPVAASFRAAQANAQATERALSDPLTGLPNRARLTLSAERCLEDAPADGGPAVMLIDLDRFKEVNDTLGHRFGDALLVAVGERLTALMGPGDHLARLGGDEFAVVVTSPDSLAAPVETARRIREALLVPFSIEGFSLAIDASVGVALHPQHGGDFETLLQHADVAMYKAKERHLHQALYDPGDDRHTPDNLALVADLRQGIAAGELELWYQPKLDLRRRGLDGLEALVRWRHPRLGLLAPGEFVEMAERTGTILALTSWVLTAAPRHPAAWQRAGRPLRVAVNISMRCLLNPDFAGEVARTLAGAGVSPSLLCLEITESALMAERDTALVVLDELRRLGVALALDDFGTGHSSLAHLRDLPVDELKIDKTFVQRLGTTEQDAAIVRSTIELGHHMGLRVVAEGVEDRRALEQLRAMDCDAVQGYYVSRPLAPDQLATFLAGWESEPPALSAAA